MAETKAPRKFVSDFTLQVGPISTNGFLTTLVKPERENKYKSVCPLCEEPHTVKQQYICTNEAEANNPKHGPFVQNDLTVKARETDEGLVKVTKEELEAVRISDLPLNVFRATVHPREEVEQHTYSGDKAYVFTPSHPDEYFALLVSMVGNPDNAFVAICNVKKNEGFYRLKVWNGNIVLEKLLWPESLNGFEPLNLETDERVVGAADAMIDRIRTPFDPEDYRSSVLDRLRAINEALGGTPDPKKVKAPKEHKVDLLSALDSFGV